MAGSTSVITLQVNTAGAWKNVLAFDRARKAEVRATIQRLAAVLPDAKWCFVLAGGKREWIQPPTDSAQESMRSLNRALDIADAAARSDVEIYAHSYPGGDSRAIYDLTRPASTGLGETEETMAMQVKIAQRAADHIRARGDALPYRLQFAAGSEHLVWFADKPARKEKTRGRV